VALVERLTPLWTEEVERLMFVALEGIDGAGKSTLAPALRDSLRSAGWPDVRMCDKSTRGFEGGPAFTRAAKLHNLIWGDPADEPERDVMGMRYHMCLHAAWFSMVRRHQVDPVCRRPGGLAIADGWFYRTVAKRTVREGRVPEWGLAMFEDVGRPDLVVLLDIAPEIAWRRRSGRFKPSDLGRWDGYDGDPFTAFCSYQGRVRAALHRLADRYSWVVVRQDDASSPDDVRDQVHAAVLRAAGRPASPRRCADA
jgi:dTMP kinase